MMNPPLMMICCLDKVYTLLYLFTHTIFIKEHLRKFPFLFPPFFPSLLQPNRFLIFLSFYSFSLFPTAYSCIPCCCSTTLLRPSVRFHQAHISHPLLSPIPMPYIQATDPILRKICLILQDCSKRSAHLGQNMLILLL